MLIWKLIRNFFLKSFFGDLNKKEFLCSSFLFSKELSFYLKTDITLFLDLREIIINIDTTQIDHEIQFNRHYISFNSKA